MRQIAAVMALIFGLFLFAGEIPAQYHQTAYIFAGVLFCLVLLVVLFK